MKSSIILASTSPRRKELLEKLGINFSIVPCPYEENNNLHKSPKELVKLLSLGKAEAVAKTNPSAIVIGSDTVVAFKGKVLGKPKDKKEAARTLRSLSGQVSVVYTGVSVVRLKPRKIIQTVEEIKVRFHKLTQKEIDLYINTGEPMDKAGAYAVQGVGAALIKSVTGDFTGAIGLPLRSLGKILTKFGIKVF